MPQVLTKPPPKPPGQQPTLKPAAKAWQEVLRACGYPADVLVLDFETYFDDSMPDSTIEYIQDSRFEVVSCCVTHMRGEYPYAEPDQRTTFHAGEDAVEHHLRYLRLTHGEDFERVTVVAQNAVFDASVLAFRYGIHPRYLIDILGLARHLNSRQRNDLGSLCKQYGLTDKGDTSQFKGLTFRTRARKPTKKGPKFPLPVPKFSDDQVTALCEYNTNDNLREWELFCLMLPQISNPRSELRIMQLTLELFTRPVLQVDFEKGNELIGLYEKQIDASLPPCMDRETISGNKSFEAELTTAIEKAGESPLQYTKWMKKGAMLALAKGDDSREELLHHTDPTIKGLMQARVAVRSWPLHIARVNRIMGQAKAAGGLLPVPLKYHGAHTGRDSGGEKINLQNLGSRGDPLITAIRGLLVAPPGHTLVIVDAAQVEARGCDWIAGQDDSLERWARNEDQYSYFASQVVGYPVRKPTKADPPPIAKRLKWARDSIGKIGVLGCQYGMGGDKAEGYAQGAIDNATAHKVVQTYRDTHRQVTAFWRDLERAFAYTARYSRACSLPRGLQFHPYQADGIILTLPNGRELHYPRVKLVPDPMYPDRQKIETYNAMEHRWEFIWGGTLTENVVQAFCRDILMDAMLRLHDLGYRTVHRIHDELVLCVPEDQGEACLKAAIAEMARTPSWAPGLPLGAEGKISRRYGK